MKTDLSASFNFADFQGLGALRRGAGDDTPEARRAVAQQFEAMFLNLMLKQMRDAGGIEGGEIGGEQMGHYQSMHDQQLALTLSEGRGIGLADAILRQFGEAAPRPVSPTSGSDAMAMLGLRGRAAGVTDTPAHGAAGWDDFRPDSAEEFVDALWPHAERAAAELGIEPEVLVAQAALESGWGQSQIRRPDGRSSFNLFGIKAGAGWDGARATVSTLEFVDGVPERSRAAFRAYPSLAEGFADYVQFVSGQDRYRPALAASTSPENGAEGYLRGLQTGGYATDPRYADKVLSILERGLPGRAVKDTPSTADTGLAMADVTRARAPGGDNQ